jgi:putative addiction module component (TIGR02574 family)
MGAQEILEMAMALKASGRFAIADRLLESLDHPDPAIDAVLNEEAERRLAAYDQDKVQTFSLDEALDHLK